MRSFSGWDRVPQVLKGEGGVIIEGNFGNLYPTKYSLHLKIFPNSLAFNSPFEHLGHPLSPWKNIRSNPRPICSCCCKITLRGCRFAWVADSIIHIYTTYLLYQNAPVFVGLYLYSIDIKLGRPIIDVSRNKRYDNISALNLAQFR